jgi:DNA-directed RNA polymerase specialized sigma24 family protein
MTALTYARPYRDRACEDTYLEVQNLLRSIVGRHRRRWGGDFDDIMSVANEAFLAAYGAYDAARGASFSTFLTAVALTHLGRWQGLQRVRPGRTPVHADLDAVPDHRARFDAAAFAAELSEDGRTIVEAVVEAPGEMADAVRPGLGGPGRRRRVVRFLRGLGWTGQRIAESFKELSEALS